MTQFWVFVEFSRSFNLLMQVNIVLTMPFHFQTQFFIKFLHSFWNVFAVCDQSARVRWCGIKCSSIRCVTGWTWPQNTCWGRCCVFGPDSRCFARPLWWMTMWWRSTPWLQKIPRSLCNSDWARNNGCALYWWNKVRTLFGRLNLDSVGLCFY